MIGAKSTKSIPYYLCPYRISFARTKLEHTSVCCIFGAVALSKSVFVVFIAIVCLFFVKDDFDG